MITDQIENRPVEHIVVLETLPVEELLEQALPRAGVSPLSVRHRHKCRVFARAPHLEVRIIGTVFESQRAAVFEVRAELRCGSRGSRRARAGQRPRRDEASREPRTWKAFAQLLSGGAHLPVHDTLVLLLLRVGLETLPWQASADEIHQHVPERLEVVATALLCWGWGKGAHSVYVASGELANARRSSPMPMCVLIDA